MTLNELPGKASTTEMGKKCFKNYMFLENRNSLTSCHKSMKSLSSKTKQKHKKKKCFKCKWDNYPPERSIKCGYVGTAFNNE